LPAALKKFVVLNPVKLALLEKIFVYILTYSSATFGIQQNAETEMMYNFCCYFELGI